MLFSSTYPKQQWGSSNTGSRPGSFSSNPGTYPKQQYGSSGSYGSNTGSYPKQQYGNTGGVPGAPPGTKLIIKVICKFDELIIG